MKSKAIDIPKFLIFRKIKIVQTTEKFKLGSSAPKSKSRLNSYFAGRVAAKKALSALIEGKHTLVIGTLDNGAPDWPDDIVGSISHCSSTALAVVAKKNNCTLLGVDIELASPADTGMVRLILRACEEKQLLMFKHIQPMVVAKIIFSAKESAWKSVSHIGGGDLDFKDFLFTFCGQHSFSVRVPKLNLSLLGSFIKSNEYIITSVWKEK